MKYKNTPQLYGKLFRKFRQSCSATFGYFVQGFTIYQKPKYKHFTLHDMFGSGGFKNPPHFFTTRPAKRKRRTYSTLNPFNVLFNCDEFVF